MLNLNNQHKSTRTHLVENNNKCTKIDLHDCFEDEQQLSADAASAILNEVSEIDGK